MVFTQVLMEFQKEFVIESISPKAVKLPRYIRAHLEVTDESFENCVVLTNLILWLMTTIWCSGFTSESESAFINYVSHPPVCSQLEFLFNYHRARAVCY